MNILMLLFWSSCHGLCFRFGLIASVGRSATFGIRGNLPSICTWISGLYPPVCTPCSPSGKIYCALRCIRSPSSSSHFSSSPSWSSPLQKIRLPSTFVPTPSASSKRIFPCGPCPLSQVFQQFWRCEGPCSDRCCCSNFYRRTIWTRWRYLSW